MNLKFILSATVAFLTIRLAIAFKLATFANIYSLTKLAAITISLLVLCHQIMEWCIMWWKMHKLPGYDWRFSKLFFQVAFSKNFNRGVSAPIIYGEAMAALSLLKYDEKENDLFAAFSWLLPAVFVKSPETFKQILHHPHAQKKGLAYWSLRFAVGNGLLTASGDKWINHRKILTPAFHFKILESVMSIIIPEAEKLVQRLEKEASSSDDRSIKDVIPHVLDNTMNVLCQSSMGVTTADESNLTEMKASVTKWMQMISCCQANPLRIADCVLGLSELAKDFNKFDRAFKTFVDEVICKRIAFFRQLAANGQTKDGEINSSSTEKTEAFIDIMIQEHLKNPNTFSLKDIRDEVKIFTSAGLDTTTWSITYTLLLLGHHQQVQEKLYQEMKQFDLHDSLHQLTPEKIKKLTYFSAVYNESLRLYPPAPAFARRITEDICVNGKIIPKGVQVIFMVRNVHRDPRFWPDPHRFKPERFFTPLTDPYSFLPFSAGPRNCIGQKYSNIQAKTAILHVIAKYRVESITQLDEVTTYAFPIAHTETPIKLRLHLRESNNN